VFFLMLFIFLLCLQIIFELLNNFLITTFFCFSFFYFFIFLLFVCVIYKITSLRYFIKINVSISHSVIYGEQIRFASFYFYFYFFFFFILYHYRNAV
jgi:hypothetical protein